MLTIGKRIRYIRSENKLTQKQFADKLGISQTHISKMEKDIENPSTTLIKLISKEFKISECWLAEGSLPIYAYEIEDEIEEAMINQTDKMNKIRTQDNIPIRSRVVKIEELFTEIMGINGVTEKNKEEYLDICYKIFYHLNSYLSFRKKSMEQKQLHLFPFPDNVLDNLQNDIASFEKFFDFWSDEQK